MPGINLGIICTLNSMKKSKRKLPKWYTAILMLFAITWLGYVSFDLYSSYQSRKWNATNGTIDEVSIGEYSYERGGTKYHYSAYVSYSYSISGKEYKGNRLAVLPIKYNSKSGIKSFLQEQNFEVGNNTKVYYKPDNILETVLIVDNAKSTTMPWVIFGFLVLCICGGVMELMGKLG